MMATAMQARRGPEGRAGAVENLEPPSPAGEDADVNRAFLFDLDGTLVDSERENAESIAQVLGALGRPLSDADRAFVVGHGWREIYEHLRQGGGVELSFDELKERAAEAKERLCERSGLSVIPGAPEFVRRAATRARVTVVSGSSRREIAFCLRLLGLSDVVPWFIGAEDVARGKPAPDGYLAAAARLGLPPRDCLVFEDSVAGIAAARSAGMRCVAISAANFLGSRQDAEVVLRDFRDVGDRFFDESA
jgi:HAD superfamily hydrolase (TIGR01509 family)